MALESINGAMSYQAQSIPSQPVTPVKEAADFTDEAANVTTQTIDATTAKITPSGEKGNGAGGDAAGQQPSYEQMKSAIEMINKKANNSTVQFGIHEATNRITVKIVDKETKEVIKEVPAEKTLDMIAKAWELAGLMVDEKG